jgi:hypothetical protein
MRKHGLPSERQEAAGRAQHLVELGAELIGRHAAHHGLRLRHLRLQRRRVQAHHLPPVHHCEVRDRARAATVAA